ncbi:MAG: SdrD B-like domain-containing protein, partial [Chitinophagales bacterium]
GTTSQTVTITVNGDTDVESDETVVLQLQNSGGAGSCDIGTDDTYTLTITNEDTGPAPICPGACKEFCVDATDLPVGGTIDYYYDTNAAFDPYNGEGTLLGSTTPIAEASPGGGLTSTSSNPACPSILGIMVDACNGTGGESDNEFILMVNGNTDLAVTTIDIAVANTSIENINSTNGFIDAATVSTTMSNAGVVGGCFTTIDGTSTIPADALVLIFTSSDLSNPYDFTDLCSSAGTIYVLMKDQASGSGSFANSSGRTTVLTVTGCGSESYSYVGSGGGDGSFFQFTGPDPTFSNAGNNSGTPAAGSAFLAQNSCTAPPIEAGSDPICFQHTFDNSFCNMGTDGTFYVKGIVRPLDSACTENDATTDLFTFNMTCPELTLSIAGNDNPECAPGNIEIQATFDTEGIYDILFTDGTNSYTEDGLVINAGNVNTLVTIETITAAGDYFFSVTAAFSDTDDDDIADGSVCAVSFTGTPNFTISTTPTATVSIETPTCQGDAVFTISPSNGTPPYIVTYTDHNGDTQTAEGGPGDFIIEGVADGTYTLVSIGDDNGLCTGTLNQSTTIDLTDPPSLNPIAVQCGNGATSIDLTSLNSSIFGGAATFDWLGIDGGAAAGQEQNYTPINGQTLRVEVTPTGGCPAYQDISFAAAACNACSLTATLTNSSPICENDDFTVTATATNGTPNYNYQWSGGITTVTASIAMATVTVTNATTSNTGTYTVTITDGNSCTATATTSITVNALPTASIQGSTVCLDETVVLSVTGNGTSYIWSGGSTASTQTVNTASAGNQTFTVTVTNANNCTNTATAEVVVNDLPTASIGDETVCLNEALTLSVATNNGTGFIWSGGSTAANQVVNTAIAGTQTFAVTVTNVDNCSTTAMASVEVNDLPTLNLQNVVVCEGETAVLDAGAGFSTYAWSNGETTQNTEVGAGSHAVVVSNAEGCTTSANVLVVGVEAPSAVIQKIANVCNDAGEGNAQVVLMDLVLGGDANGVWTNASGAVVTGFDGSGLTGTFGFVYTLTGDGICPPVTYGVTIGVQNCLSVCAELDGNQEAIGENICSGNNIVLVSGGVIDHDFGGGTVEWVYSTTSDFDAYGSDATVFTGFLPENVGCDAVTYYLKARLGGVVNCMDSSEAYSVVVYPNIEGLTMVSSEACSVTVETCPDFEVNYNGAALTSPATIELLPSDESPINFVVVNPTAPTACQEVAFTESFVCEEEAGCCNFVAAAKMELQACSGDNLDLQVEVEGNCPNDVQWSNGLSGTIINTGDLVNDTCEPIEVVFTAVLETEENCPQQTQTFTITVLPIPSMNNIEVNKNDCRIEVTTCETFEVMYSVNGGAFQAGTAYTAMSGELADIVFAFNSSDCGSYNLAEQIVCENNCPTMTASDNPTSVSICAGDEAVLAVNVGNADLADVEWSNGEMGGMIEVGDLVNNTCEPIIEVYTATLPANGDCAAAMVDFEVTVFPNPSNQAMLQVSEDGCTVEASACPNVSILYQLTDGTTVANDSYTAEFGSGITMLDFYFTSPYSCGNVVLSASISCLELGALGNFVWNDLNGDGQQDLGEPGVEGIFVHLYSADGVLLATTRTDENGFYIFEDLPAGDYYVVFDIPENYATTNSNAGDDALDSDVLASGLTEVISLGQGEVNLTIDAGIVGVTVGSISNFVWLDVNGNGVQDAGEPGVPNVTINLLDDEGNVIDSTTTDENGNYAFTDLPLGNYQIEVENIDVVLVELNDGEDDGIDSDVNPLTGLSDIITLGLGESDVTIDVGIRPSNCGNIAQVFVDGNDCIVTDGLLNIATNEVTLGFGEVMVYVLYTDPENVLGSIIAQNETPSFAIDMDENPNVFVAAISGPDLDGDGLPDVDAICFNIAIGPSIQAQVLSLDVELDCLSNNLSYELDIQIFDAVDGRYDIEVNGTVVEDVPANQLFEYGNFTNGETYTVQIIEAETGCVLASVGGIGDCIKLPVSLLDFNGEVLKEGNQLQWITASELNNDYFNLYYSMDGINFEVIATIEGNGTTSEANLYEFLHRETATGTVYYYLSQTDFGGKTERISQIISLNRGEISTFDLVEVLPIPSSDFVNVRFNAPQEASDMQIGLYDVLGRNVWSSSYKVNSGYNDLEVDVRGLTIGVYVLTLEVNGERIQTKIVVE